LDQPQEDGSISIGFTDRAFTFSGLESTQELDGYIHREQVDLSSQHNRKALVNPHFTLHPPMYVHLQNQEKEEIVAGLVWAEANGLQDENEPWIRFISNPVKELKLFTGSRRARAG
jgi:hypothetical protein